MLSHHVGTGLLQLGYPPKARRRQALCQAGQILFKSRSTGLNDVRHPSGQLQPITLYRFGAKQGIGRGYQGNSYAIATLPRPYQPALHIDDIKEQIEDFSTFTFCNPDKQFIVSAIGTGFAQIPTEVIAPLFNIGTINCWFPVAWKPYLQDI